MVSGFGNRSTFNQYATEFSKEIKVFSAKVSKLTGKKGVYTRLNSKHATALIELSHDPNNKRLARRVIRILRAERKIIEICYSALECFMRRLSYLEEIGRKLFRPKILANIEYVRAVVKIFHEGLIRLSFRNHREIEDINQGNSIDSYIKDIEGELLEILKSVKSVNVKKLNMIKTLFTNLANTHAGEEMKYLVKDTAPLFEYGAVEAIPRTILLTGGSLLLSIPVMIEALSNLMGSFLIEEKQLMASIHQLKKSLK